MGSPAMPRMPPRPRCCRCWPVRRRPTRAPIKVEVKPGYMFRYSGGGYSVVQLLLTEVTGTPFPE